MRDYLDLDIIKGKWEVTEKQLNWSLLKNKWLYTESLKYTSFQF